MNNFFILKKFQHGKENVNKIKNIRNRNQNNTTINISKEMKLINEKKN